MKIQNIKDILSQQLTTAQYALDAIVTLENIAEEQASKIKELNQQLDALKVVPKEKQDK
jgi:hypothetical protein